MGRPSPFDRGDLHYWSQELYPFFLVLYDAANDRAYWLHIQTFVEENPSVLHPDKDQVTVHIPTKNSLTPEAVDMFRSLSCSVVEEQRKKGGFPYGRKPK